MATPSLFPLSFKQALQAASSNTARHFDILVTVETEEAQPYRVALRKINTPQKRVFGFPSVVEAESFLRQLATFPVAQQLAMQ